MSQNTIIIGGGVMGLSVAYRLAYRLAHQSTQSSSNNSPHSITVIDSPNPQSHQLSSASSQAAGILATHGAQHFLSPLRRQIVQSIRSYSEFLSELGDVLGEDIISKVNYHPITHYHLYDSSPQQQEVLRKRLRRLKREHVDRAVDGVEDVPPQSLLSLLSKSDFFSTDITGLKFNSHTLEPPELLDTLRQAGRALGVNYLAGKVIQIDGREGGVVVRYIDGDRDFTISTDKIVLATGSETGDILQHINADGKKNIFPHRLYNLKNLSGAILVTEPFLSNELDEVGEILINFYDKKYLLHKKDRALFGSYDYRESRESRKSPISDENLEMSLQKNLIRLFPHLASKPPQTLGLLTGKRLYYHDKLPLLGYLTQNIFMATALYKSGLALAPLYSRLATEMLCYRNNEVIDIDLTRETNYLSPLR